MTESKLIDFCKKNDFCNHPENPLKPSEFEWIFKNRKCNGFDSAFVRVTARNFLVHLPTFVQCLADRRGA
jgi:hypothetical protein